MQALKELNVLRAVSSDTKCKIPLLETFSHFKSNRKQWHTYKLTQTISSLLNQLNFNNTITKTCNCIIINEHFFFLSSLSVFLAPQRVGCNKTCMQAQKTLLSWFNSSSEVVTSSRAVSPPLAVYTLLEINFQQHESMKTSVSVSTTGWTYWFWCCS